MSLAGREAAGQAAAFAAPHGHLSERPYWRS
jgi:hypothetical protein